MKKISSRKKVGDGKLPAVNQPKSPDWWEDYYYSNFNFFHHTHKIFHINKLSETVRISQLKFYPLPPYRKPVYDFMFVTKGVVKRSKSLDSYDIKKNCIFFLPAYQLTTITSMSADTEGYYCHFNLDIFSNSLYSPDLINHFSFFDYIGNPIIRLDVSSQDFILQLLSHLEKEYQKEECDLELVATCLVALFTDVNRFAKQDLKKAENSATRVAENYKNVLALNIHDEQKIGFYARKLCVTPEYLNRCIKSTYGKTSRELLYEMVIMEAKALLKQSSLNVSEIAFKFQRKNPSDFIRFFKSKTGLTPKQYREKV